MNPLADLYKQLVQYAPTVALFFAVILVGLLASWFGKRFTRWLVRSSGIEALAERAGAAQLLYAVGLKSGVAELLGTIVWLLGVLLTLAAAAEIMGLPALASGVTVVMAFMPRLIAAGVLLLAGLSFATVLRGVVGKLGRKREDLEHPDVLAGVVYYVVLSVVFVLAAGQAGIETALIDALVVICAAIGLTALALVFVLNSRAAFRNIVAGHYMKRVARVGDHVRLGEHAGIIVRYGAVAVILRTDEGDELVVPCSRLIEDVVRVRRVAPASRRVDAT